MIRLKTFKGFGTLGSSVTVIVNDEERRAIQGQTGFWSICPQDFSRLGVLGGKD